MPSLEQLVNSKNRRPTALVRVNGYQCQIPNISGAISISGSFGQPVRGGSVQIVNASFVPKIKMPIYIEWGFNGLNVPAFSGFIENVSRASYPKSYTLQLKDTLGLADFPIEEQLDDDITSGMFFGNNKTALFVATQLLTVWGGIPADRLSLGAMEQSPGVDWLLGTLTPIKFTGSPLAAVLKICDALGMWLFCDRSGIIRTVRMSGAPTGYPFVALNNGQDLLVDGAPVVNSNLDQVYNQVLVTGGPTGVAGAVVRDKYRVDTTLLPEGVDRTFTYSNELVEFVNKAQGGDASCTAIAERMVTEHAREPYTVTLKVKANPIAQVGQTMSLRDPRLSLNSPRRFFIMGLSTTFGGAVFEQSYTLDGGVGPAGYTLIPPPLATFTWRLMSETMDGADVIDIFVDGTASQPMGGGEIVQWDWELEPNDAVVPGSPFVGSGPYFTFVVPATTTEVTITLTVTEVTSKTNSFTQVVPLVGSINDVPAKRALNFAGTGWYVTPNGGKDWSYDSAPLALAVPPIGNQGSAQSTDLIAARAIGLIATGGATANRLRRTNDYLATPATFLTNPPGVVNFVWQNERDPLRLWVAVGGSVHLSVDGGVSWGPARTPTPFAPEDTDHNVRWIVEAFDNFGVIDVLAGRYCFTSFDAGVHWQVSLAGPVDSIARCYVSGFERHIVGFTNVPDDSSALRSIEGDTCAFPVDVDPKVNDIMAITVMLSTLPVDPLIPGGTQTPATGMVFAFDKQGRIWRTNVDDLSITDQVGVMPDA
jgi:hypothetical protein